MHGAEAVPGGLKVFVSQKVTFHPKDGSPKLDAEVTGVVPKVGEHQWFDLLVNNSSVEDGSPHRHFETRARMRTEADTSVLGLFEPHIAGPAATIRAEQCGRVL